MNGEGTLLARALPDHEKARAASPAVPTGEQA
jgi:hypothetical protein